MAVGSKVSRSGVTLSAKSKGYVIITSGDSGTFLEDETVTGGTSSATATVGFYDATNNELVLYNVSGTFQASETLTGGTSSATATASTLTGAGSYLTNYVTITSDVTDSFNLNETRNAQRYPDMGSNENDPVDLITGNLEIGGSTTMYIVPGGDAYGLVLGAMHGNLEVTFKRAIADRDGSNTRTDYLTGFISSRNEQLSVDGLGTVPINFELSATSLTDPT